MTTTEAVERTPLTAAFRLIRRLAPAASIAVLIAACSAAAEATPQIVEVPGPTVEVPGPTQTVTVEVEVEVVPQACIDALDEADDLMYGHIDVLIGILSDYLDFPEENLAEFGARVETRIADDMSLDDGDAYFDAAARCRAGRGGSAASS